MQPLKNNVEYTKNQVLITFLKEEKEIENCKKMIIHIDR